MRQSRSTSLGALLFLVACMPGLGGCARYKFDVVSPADLRRHIGHDADTVIGVGDVEYRLRAVEDRLVVRIYNRSNVALRVLGDQSTTVDPSGQSHPLRGMTLPPGSYMKLILPPPVRVEPTGPTIGFGLGLGVAGGSGGRRWDDGAGVYAPLAGQPRYVAVYDGADPPWAWPANGEVRLLLTFDRGDGKPTTQEWVFRKVKV